MLGARLAVAAVLALGAVAPTPAAAQEANAVVGRASRVYRSLAALQADFAQTIDDPMLGPEDSKGVLVQSGEAKLSMRFTDPKDDAIVVDGKHAWIYTPSTTPGQVIRAELPSGGPVYGFNLLGWLLDKPSERYKTTYLRPDTLNGRSMDVVELVPLSDDLPFTRAVLWLDKEDALPRRLDVRERGGLRRTLVLSNLRPNAPVTDKTFVFDVPGGVRVVRQ